MSVAPPRKKSRAVFWIATIIIGSIILATALLANDMRNLRALDARYHLGLLSGSARQPSPPAVTKAALSQTANSKPAEIAGAKSAPANPGMTAAAPPRKQATPAKSPAAAKPQSTRRSHIFDLPVDPLRGAFVRSWRITGQALCDDLSKSGLAVGQWSQSALGAGTFECSYEIQKGGNGDPSAASFFIIVRGTPTGELDNIRIKVIMPDNADGRAIGETFVDAVVLLLTETRWLDFQAALDAIGKLQDVTLQAFGAKLSFFREFRNDRSFNLQLGLERKSPEQIRTAIVFDKARWTLPSPPLAK
ncbi:MULTISPECIES: DUF6030 family protein [Rhizobium]|uniref:Exopolysaccharide biosynthesis protein n=1 Tax=Rhizobium paranaense TaxID=1650438 RepID=A0A7W8XPH0_9HYPH|nr:MULTISPECIES: DUF6030 family protein [Rhizobium]MBB5573116.1 hypothetical protein [Rhizobium paranaense]PST62157.1 exopolysaccharide biosynthesis protein [Rhizobium sp. SEMIA4064]